MTTDQKIERFFEAHPWAMFPAAAVTVAAGWAGLYILFYFPELPRCSDSQEFGRHFFELRP